MDKPPNEHLEPADNNYFEKKTLMGVLAQQGMALDDSLRDCGGCADGQTQCHHRLQEAVGRVHENLHSAERFEAALQEARNTPPLIDQPWRFHLLAETARVRIGLLKIFRASPIPLHDHPGACGAQYLIAGRARIRQYDSKDGLEYGHRHVVTLKQVVDEELTRGDCSAYLDNYLNFHEVESITPSSILLSLMVSMRQKNGRSWYFPADPFRNSSERIYTRVTRRTQGSEG